MLSDAHCHYDGAGALAAKQQEAGVLALVNCGSPAEWRQNRALIGPQQRLSFGVHPWAARDFDLAALRPYYRAATVIGEIGLDSVWTEVPQAVQRPVFWAQLQLAARLHKPVILHTKGQEAACLAAMRAVPNRYLVHWYSAAAGQAAYIATGCYLSIGVDVDHDPAVRALAARVPSNRLLLESDGIESLAWAWQRPVTVREYPAALQRSAAIVAALRGTTTAAVQQAAAANLRRFIAGA